MNPTFSYVDTASEDTETQEQATPTEEQASPSEEETLTIESNEAKGRLALVSSMMTNMITIPGINKVLYILPFL